jgi:hypothetical protein
VSDLGVQDLEVALWIGNVPVANEHPLNVTAPTDIPTAAGADAPPQAAIPDLKGRACAAQMRGQRCGQERRGG